jgi:hypothetical protein
LEPIVWFGEEALDLAEQSMHRIRRDVGAAMHDLSVLGEDGGRRPTAHIVAGVHVSDTVIWAVTLY